MQTAQVLAVSATRPGKSQAALRAGQEEGENQVGVHQGVRKADEDKVEASGS